MAHDPTSHDDTREQVEGPTPKGGVAAFGLALFLFDALILNQGAIAAAVLLLLCPALAIRAVMAWRDRPLMRARLVNAGILALASLLVLAANRLNNDLAYTRAATLIGALEVYKVRHGSYPARLDGLVPEFLPEVPAAKLTLVRQPFTYLAADGSHTLMYATFPPFGRSFYNLEEKRWGELD